MKCIVSRTTVKFDASRPPCAEAYPIKVNVDISNYCENEDQWAVNCDLIEFIKLYGKCVVSVDHENVVHIEIYDGYRK
jgi:hypothetical protein